MTPIATEIQVVRRVRGEWFVYTSDAMPGLYVASKDDKVAYNDLPAAIRMLFKLDFGSEVSVHHKIDYATFMLGDKARAALEERTRDLMDSHQQVLSFMIGRSDGDLASRSH
jgi:hypothetical protein